MAQIIWLAIAAVRHASSIVSSYVMHGDAHSASTGSSVDVRLATVNPKYKICHVTTDPDYRPRTKSGEGSILRAREHA